MVGTVHKTDLATKWVEQADVAVFGFGGLRMLGGKLCISPNLPKAWKKLCYTLLWKGQRLTVTVTPTAVEINNETGSSPVELEVWGKEYTIEQELILCKKKSAQE